MSARLRPACFFLWCFAVSPVAALEFLQNGAAHSLNGLYGIPSPVVTGHGNHRVNLGLVHSNMFAQGTDGNTDVLLDGERTRITLGWHGPLATCLDAGAELPLIAHADGFLDRPIEDWHAIFNLPNAGREDVEPNLLQVSYQDASGKRLEVNQAQSAFGDARLSLLWTPGCASAARRPGQSTASLRVLRIGLKLPTGQLKTLSGSGETDVFADITTGTKQFHPRLQARAAFGFLLAGQVEGFSQQRSTAAYGTAALAVTLSSRLTAMAQIDWHTPLFDTGLTELGDVSAMFSAGLRWTQASGQRIEFAVVEDVSPDTGPDISIMLNWRRSVGASPH